MKINSTLCNLADNTKTPVKVFLYFEFFVLPTGYFPSIASIIAAQKLNFSVRNGKRCDPLAKSGEQKIQNGIK